MHLATRQNHAAAARFLALAADARRAALNECVDWIERGTEIPPYCRIDTASARYYAEQSRYMQMRAIQSRYSRAAAAVARRSELPK